MRRPMLLSLSKLPMVSSARRENAMQAPVTAATLRGAGVEQQRSHRAHVRAQRHVRKARQPFRAAVAVRFRVVVEEHEHIAGGVG